VNDMTAPAAAAVGDKIEHDLIPGFVMTVEDVKPCHPDGTRLLEHSQFQVTDPEGTTDWLCAYDVHPAREGT
jgi:hypothetical protein